MDLTATSIHLSGTEGITLTAGSNHVALRVGGPLSTLGLVFSDYNDTAQNAAWLRELAKQASALADLAEVRAVMQVTA